MINITLYAEPVAQGRPRFSTAGGYARAYDPAKSRNYKQLLSLSAEEQLRQQGGAMLDEPIFLSVRVYRSIPKSFSKKKQAQAERGELRPITKPDIDNYVKGIKDALNGICWRDDSLIIGYVEPFGKFYSSQPRIEVDVYRLGEGKQ